MLFFEFIDIFSFHAQANDFDESYKYFIVFQTMVTHYDILSLSKLAWTCASFFQ